MARGILAALIVALLAGCASAPPPKVPSMQERVEQVKFRLYVLVEEQRHRLNADAKPLALDPELVTAAQVHSEDMAKKRSFDTMNPDGNPAVNTLLADPTFQGFVAENSAAQYFSPAVGFDPEQMAKGFLDIWLNSPGHKSNLAFAPFNRTGIGVAVNGNAIYAAEVFATDFDIKQH
jgi:uncharacterized protein YkwD